MTIVETFVKQGFGIGMSVALPGKKVTLDLRTLPLPDFPRVPVGMIWRSNPSEATQALLSEFRRVAKRLVKS